MGAQWPAKPGSPFHLSAWLYQCPPFLFAASPWFLQLVCLSAPIAAPVAGSVPVVEGRKQAIQSFQFTS